ncbi:MAG TPA: hypothetical protein VNM92_08055 [Thermoanaerobaculia bacterium]|nr:hypothetical protein [Thermoanaerobaculia bacterium]
MMVEISGGVGMKWNGRRLSILLVALVAPVLLSCSEINKAESPVDLIATVNQTVSRLDLADPACGGLGTIQLRAVTRRTDVADARFLDVQLRSYRVTYVRTDGGRTVPASFVRSISGLLAVNGGVSDSTPFFAFDFGALNQAPFAALRPNNGGVDPETGQRQVKLDVIIDVFGETLSGQNVSAQTRQAITVCVACGGCV